VIAGSSSQFRRAAIRVSSRARSRRSAHLVFGRRIARVRPSKVGVEWATFVTAVQRVVELGQHDPPNWSLREGDIRSCNFASCLTKLRAAVAAKRPERVTGQALRVEPGQDRAAVADIPTQEGNANERQASAVQFVAPYVVEVADVAIPEPGPGDVLVRAEFSGISGGTEMLLGDRPRSPRCGCAERRGAPRPALSLDRPAPGRASGQLQALARGR
jgi:hypothetical protein